MNKLIKIFALSVLCVLVWAFISCEVGLGDSVDVNPPTLVIDYPPVASVVRDEFILSGTCEDDGEVASVQVSVIDGNNVPVGEPRKAEIKDGRWTAALNKNNGSSWELPDGKYTFSVVAEDGAGRKSDKLERTLEIDNTAPVFIVKNPGTIKKDSPASYGSAFKVIGLMAEDHEVSKMIVKVYDEAGSVKEWTEEAVETAGGTEVTFASYNKDAGAENELNSRYLSIYDEKTGGDQNFSCTITVMDSAKKYRTPESGAPSDDNGNTSDAHFLYDDVYTDLMGKTSDYGLTVSEIKQILNGTYSQGTAAASDEGDASRAAAPIDDAKVKEVLEKLEKYLTDTSQNEKRLQFKLNKDANPTWEIMGYASSVSGDSIDFSDNTGSKGGKITFKASYGLDETYFYPNTLKVYLFGPYDPNNPKDAVNKAKKVEIYDDPDKYYTNAIENAKKIYTGSNEELLAAEAKAWLLFDGSTDEAYKDAPSASETSISLPPLPTITAGRQYLFAASGHDMDELDFRPSADCYAFIGVASGTPPTITVTSPPKNSTPVKKDGSLVISGTANGRGSTIEKIWYETTVYDEGSGNKEVGTVSGTVETLNGKDDGSWSFDIRTGTQKPNEEGGYTSCLPGDNVMYKYSTVVYIQNAAGLESQDNVDVRIDSKNPEPRITSVTPIAQAAKDADSLEVVNGTITISASVADANIKKSVLTISNGTGTSVEADKEEQTFFEHTFDTTCFADETDLTITLTSTDSAGNTASVSKKVHISQATDKPLVASETSDTLKADEIAPNKNLFGVTSNNIFKATVTDDDGIGYLQLNVKKAPGGEVVSGYPKDLSADAKDRTSYSLSDTLPEQEGKYTVEITVRDNQYADGLSETVKDFRSNSYTYNIGIDAANPKLEFTTPNRANTADDKDKEVEGIAKDTSGIKSIRSYSVKTDSDVGETGDLVHSWESGASDGISVTEDTDSSGCTSVTWKDSIASSILKNGSNRRRYIVEDVYGNTTTLDFVYYVDNVSPVISTVEGISADGIINGGQIFQVKGAAFDKDNKSNAKEVSSVRWKVAKKDESVSLSGGKYAGADGWETAAIGVASGTNLLYPWTATIDLHDDTSYPDGEYVLYLAAFDAAGNQSEAVATAVETAADNKPATQIAFTNDKTAPKFGTITIAEDSDASHKTTGTSLSAKGAVTISGILTESNLKTLEVKLVSSGKTTVNEVTVGDNGSWTHPISAPGNYSVSFTATDLAGNTATTATYTVEIDTEKPTVVLDDFADGKWLNSKDFALRVYVNDLTDSVHTSYIKNVTASILKADGTDTIEEKMLVLSTTSATPGAGKTLYTGSVEGLSEGKKKLKVTAEDNVGNQTVLENITFTVDITSPELMIDEYTSPSNVVQTVTGTVSDTIGTVLLSVTKTETTGDTSTTADPVSIEIGDNGAWSYTLDAPGSTTEKTVKLTFVATDNAGNKTTKTEEVILDGEKPDITVPSKYKAWAKPEAEEWRNTGTQTVYVLLPANDLSGIAEVKYSYGTGENAVEGDFLQGSRVSYDSANKTASDSSNGNYRIWSTTIDLPEGFTNIEVTAKDGAGNSQSAQTLIPYHIDTTMPSVVKVEATPANVNASTETVTLSIDVSDKNTNESINVSGLKSWRVKVGSYEKSGDFSDENNIDITEYTVDISAEDAFVGDNSVVQVFVTDNAGNTSPAGTVTVQSDTTRPVVKINKLPDSTSAVKLNKKATISGTISDTGFVDVGSKALVLEVSSDKNTWNKVTNAAGTFGKLTYDTTAKQTSVVWTAEINTEQFYTAGNASGSLYVRMTAYDEAGNSNTKILYNGAETEFAETSVNQDHDRPVLRFTSMDKFDGSWSTSTGVVAGSIVDDDKADGTVVKGLWYIDADAYNASQLPTADTDNGWTNVAVDDAGNWEITIGSNEAQGVRTWHFYVIDNANGTFCNTLETTNALHCPYFQYKTDEKTKTNCKDGITFTVDTEAPKDVAVALALGDSGTTPPADGEGVWKTTDGAVFGPNQKQGGALWIRVTLNENVGMPAWSNKEDAKKPVELTIGGVPDGTYVTAVKGDAATPYTYYFTKALSSLTTSGSLSIAAKVQDSSGLVATANRSFIVDTDKPDVTILSPSASIADKVLGKISIRGMASDTNFVSSVSKLEWTIPKKDPAESEQKWTEIENIPASGSYSIEFTNAADKPEGILYYVQDAQAVIYNVTEVTTIPDSDEWAQKMEAAKYPLKNYAGCFKVPVWFRATDAVGNVGYVKDTFIVVDRDGGKPLVSINTPEENAIVSGTVTIYGTATDDISVKDVRLQIDANNDEMFDSTDYDLLATDAYPPLNGEKSVSGDAKGTEQNAWYLLAEGTNSWKLTIPTNLIAPGGNGKLRVRAMAFDYDGNTRGWSAVRIATIDANAPQIKNLRVVQYGQQYGPGKDDEKAKHGQTYTPVSERAYEAGMYISDASVTTNGQWYLTADVTDNESVKEILFDKLKNSTNSGIDLTLNNETDIAAGTKSYKLNIPLITKNSGQIYYKITANDNSSGTTTQVITINIDSTAPSVYTVGNIGTNVSTDNVRLQRNNVSRKVEDGAAILGKTYAVTNSDGLFTFGDVVSEDGSGLHSVSFWFERTASGDSTRDRRVYCPMFTDGSAPNYANRTDISDSKTNGKVYINADGLPALYLQSAQRDGENKLSDSLISGNRNIQDGGLVKIAGTYCKIDKVDGSTITFTPSISKDFIEAEIILAQVVDHQLKESINSDGTVTNDDGDKMVESIEMAGSTYTWSAGFDSQNIPDGPITVHITAMDKAGNVTTGSIATQVSNNRPRIAKVLIGTDLNSNGTFDYNSAKPLHTADGEEAPATNGKAFGEFSYYSALGEKNEAQSKVTLVPVQGGKSFKVRDGLIIVPEFVGGNGSELKYAWTHSDSTETKPDEPTKAAEEDLSSLVKKDTGALQLNDGSNGGRLFNKGSQNIMDEIGEFGAIVLTGDTNGILGLNGEKTLSITFWDGTEETTQGTDSQWALLNIPLEFSTTDTTAPNAKIKPFYWKPETINGAVSISGSVPIDDKGNKLGHIELEDDLPSSFTAEGTGVDDRDPKVSGQIKLEGTVYDDWLLGSVSVTFGSLISNQTLATYTGGAWTPSSLPVGVESFKISDTEISQDGHTASWTLVLDTEQISVSAAADVPFSIVATDQKGGNKNEPGTVSTTDAAETDYYRMDVVPYVTEIKTSLSEFSKGAPSVYARTARGHYPVRAGDKIELKGWNLGSAPDVKLDSATLGTGTTLTIPTTVSSGNLEVSVNSVPALNNKNENDAGMAAENSLPSFGYNRQPNSVNNDTLTDNLELDVWEFKNAAVPVNEGAHHVTMKVRPTDGSLGFSYGHDIVYFSMPGYEINGANSGWSDQKAGVDANKYYSHIPVGMNYGGFTYNTFCYDSYGYSYGSAICTDTQMADKSAFFQFFSRETPELVKNMDQNMNYHNSANASRLDQTTVQIAQSGGYVTNIDRIQSISMEATINGGGEPTNDNPTYVYIAYYDKSARQVRFRWGTVGANGDNIDGKQSASRNFGTIPQNAYGLNDVVSVGDNNYKGDGGLTGHAGFHKSDGNNRQSAKDSYVMYSQNCNNIPIQIIVADDVPGGKSIYRASKGAVGTDYGTGEYVSLSIVDKDTANHVAVVSWYDAKNRHLCMAYNTNPTGSTTWNATVIDPDGGINVKTAVDGSGGIHFAYYDNMGGSDLKYAYMPRYNASQSEIKCVIVDSYGAVGAKPTIDVVQKDGRWIPYIGYQSNAYLGTPAAAKMAYYAGSSSEISAGAEGDKYTGAWETTVVPTESLPDDDLINIGLYRNSDGTIKAFPKGTGKTYNNATLGSAITNESTAKINCGVPALIYGNGTSNPVVAYATKNGPIEMAQKK